MEIGGNPRARRELSVKGSLAPSGGLKGRLCGGSTDRSARWWIDVSDRIAGERGSPPLPDTLPPVAEFSACAQSFYFELSHPFTFRAGQHVDVRLTAPDLYQAERSYSIALAPHSQTGLELVIERLDDGDVSPFFHDVAEVGDDIELRGPIGGHFVGRSPTAARFCCSAAAPVSCR